jgi:superfamily II DNA or RNA helicase
MPRRVRRRVRKTPGDRGEAGEAERAKRTTSGEEVAAVAIRERGGDSIPTAAVNRPAIVATRLPYVRVVGVPSDVVVAIRERFRFFPRHRPNRPTPRPTVFMTPSGVTYVGFVDAVVDALREVGYDDVAVSVDTPPPSPVPFVDDPPLIPIQRAVVATAVARRRGVIAMATGTGKTDVAAAVVASVGVPAVVVVPTVDVAVQTVRRFARRLPTVRVAQAAGGVVEDGDVVVGCVPTLIQCDDAVRRARVVVVDEAHHTSARTWREVLRKCPAPYRYATTATPSVGDDVRDAWLRALIGPIIATYDATAAANDGVVRPVVVYRIAVPPTPTPPTPTRADGTVDWTELERVAIVECAVRTDVIAAATVYCATTVGPTLVIARRRDHAVAIAAAIRECGVADVAVIDGTMSPSARATAWDALRGGRIRCVVATPLADEGVDVPAVRAVVLAGGGRADHRVLQRVGRGMRRLGSELGVPSGPTDTGATPVVVVDVDDRHHPILATHARRRLALYRRMGWPVVPIVSSASVAASAAVDAHPYARTGPPPPSRARPRRP